MEVDNNKICEICCDKYTKVQRIKLTCSCGAKICKQCVQTYLITSKNDPDCMKCKKPYDRRFITENLNITYIKGALRKHEKKLIIDNEMSKMLDTQQHVAVYVAEKKFTDDYVKITKERDALIAKIRHESEKKLIELNKDRVHVKKEKVQFKYPCPIEDCRGFVSVKGNCGTCNCKVCTTCNQIKEVDHECNQDDIASFELIKKETKPCPQCGERIQKISGCDQMWCAAEKKPGEPCGCLFSWKTGQIETNKVNHNPEYYKFIKTNGLQIRNPGDVVCGGIIPYHIFHATIRRNKDLCNLESKHILFKNYIEYYNLIHGGTLHAPTNPQVPKASLQTMMDAFHRGISDLGHRLTQIRTTARGDEARNLRLRIQYSVKEITEDQFMKAIMKLNTDKTRAIELLKPIELYNTIGIEQLNSVRENFSTKNVMKVADVILNTIKFINEELLKANKGYSGTPYQITPNFILRK